MALFFLLITASYSDTLVVFTLSWDPPTTGDATSFNIYMGEVSAVVEGGGRRLGLYSGRVALGNQPSVQVFLNHPRTYFTITAVNALGEGPPSNELVVLMDGNLAPVESGPES